MAVWIQQSGERKIVHPKDGNTFSLEELQEYVGGYIERIVLEDGRMLWMDEEGKLKRKEINIFATQLTRGLVANDDLIVGDTLLTDPGEVE